MFISRWSAGSSNERMCGSVTNPWRSVYCLNRSQEKLSVEEQNGPSFWQWRAEISSEGWARCCTSIGNQQLARVGRQVAVGSHRPYASTCKHSRHAAERCEMLQPSCLSAGKVWFQPETFWWNRLLGFKLKSVDSIQVSLKSGENNTVFTRGPTCIYVNKCIQRSSVMQYTVYYKGEELWPIIGPSSELCARNSEKNCRMNSFGYIFWTDHKGNVSPTDYVYDSISLFTRTVLETRHKQRGRRHNKRFKHPKSHRCSFRAWISHWTINTVSRPAVKIESQIFLSINL